MPLKRHQPAITIATSVSFAEAEKVSQLVFNQFLTSVGRTVLPSLDTNYRYDLTVTGGTRVDAVRDIRNFAAGVIATVRSY